MPGLGKKGICKSLQLIVLSSRNKGNLQNYVFFPSKVLKFLNLKYNIERA